MNIQTLTKQVGYMKNLPMDMRIKILHMPLIAKYKGKKDKSGAPYVGHLLRVKNSVSERAKAVALFHDILEDHLMTPKELSTYLKDPELAAVLILTRDPEETYEEYIERISNSYGIPADIAREVKIADLHDNLRGTAPELESLKERYVKALNVLEKQVK